MDLRVERTKQSIKNAFLELRAKKPLEKITIKELSELAYINKATFYSHYDDIYDLSNQLETELMDMILANIPHPKEFITKPRESTKLLASAFLSHQDLIHILFGDNRFSILVPNIEARIKNKIYAVCPEYKNDLEQDIILTYLIQGGFHTFLTYSQQIDTPKLIEMVGSISERILK